MTKPTQYLSVTAAKDTFGVSRVTIYKWIAQGKIDSAEIAGRTVIVSNAKLSRLWKLRSAAK